MTKRKIMMLSLALCMVAILAIGGTLAYFTDTETATNVFTVGGVDITLFESEVRPEDDAEGFPGYVDADGDDRTVTENTYASLLPGSYICKDPTVTNVGETDAYIRVSIKHNNQDAIFNAFESETAFLAALQGMSNTLPKVEHTDVAWKLADGTAGADATNRNTYDLAANEKIYVMWLTDALSKDEFITMFTGIQIPKDFDEADMEAFDDLKITIWADAIQADGFANVQAAFEAFDAAKNN